MRLLTPTEMRKEKRAELTKDLVLSQKVNRVSKEKRQELNDIKTNYDSQVQKMETEFTYHLEKHNIKVNLLVNEVATLESRRVDALKPITLIEQEATRKNKEADQRTEELDAIETQQVIHEGEVLKRERATRTKESELAVKESDLEIDRQNVADGMKEALEQKQHLAIEKTEHTAYVLEVSNEIESQRGIILTDRQTLNSTKLAVELREKTVDKEWKKIADQRATLERAFNRLKK